jgi:hypothetical protein
MYRAWKIGFCRAARRAQARAVSREDQVSLLGDRALDGRALTPRRSRVMRHGPQAAEGVDENGERPRRMGRSPRTRTHREILRMLIRKTQMLFAALSFTFALGACVGSEIDSEVEDESDVAEAQSPLPGFTCSTTYFDAPNGNVVGHCNSSCSGGKWCTGIKTAYYAQSCESCSGSSGGGGGEVGCYTSWGYCAPEYSYCVSC